MIADGATQGVVLAALIVLALGYAVVFAMTRIAATAEGARKIWPILNAEAMIVGVVLVIFFFAPVLMGPAFVLFTMRIVWEAATIRFRPVPGSQPVVWAIGAAALLLVLFIFPWQVAVMLLALGWLGAMAWRIMSPKEPAADLLVFPVLPTLGFAIACTGGNEALFLAAWIGIETFDSYALLAGKVFGKRKAFPKLSPNKTIEGLAGGAIMLVLTALVAAALLSAVSVWQAIGFALLIGVFTVTGDLSASRMKRAMGVKDYPKLVAHQGGLFDIFDSWIATGGALAVVLASAAMW
ncbi:phosphatidate cytidylyltransferase [Oceanicola sp. 22II-s10i]|uniref:phosphatidate cytidylyltransferase n=1 Tax=Oceanicola sp. 22II-s10i TaxID=1317116 RepID=UPI000B528830|nr:phosphatidate cytidylyltransferase [Oceanicola sp. 22II-s10i]